MTYYTRKIYCLVCAKEATATYTSAVWTEYDKNIPCSCGNKTWVSKMVPVMSNETEALEKKGKTEMSYKVCKRCNATLDPAEKCDCREKAKEKNAGLLLLEEEDENGNFQIKMNLDAQEA